jgi:hypothetical protein
LLAMFGVAAVVLGPGVTSRHQLVGDLLAVGAMLSWSAYWLISKRARSMEKALEYSAVVMIVAAVTLIPTVLLSRQSLSRVETGDWLWICLLAVVPGGSHLLMNWAHRGRVEQRACRCCCGDGHPPAALEWNAGRWWPRRYCGDRGCRDALPASERMRAGG